MPNDDARVLVDASTGDDAAVYQLDENRALVATADFFTPIVDDAYDFGRIAAANALSDIYAMGARPLFALNLVGFPRHLLGESLLVDILRGGADIAREAGIPIVGGHSIDDAEPKYGLSVVGEVHPQKIVRNGGAQYGDALILTKPIGTGIIATALKNDKASPASVTAAINSMVTLNKVASETMLEFGAHAATDVTGFGLVGHLNEMVRSSPGLGARLHISQLPLLEGTPDLAQSGQIPGGTRRNYEDAMAFAQFADQLPEWLRFLVCDAQTSGGLLIACPQQTAQKLLHTLVRERTPAAAIIGEITRKDGLIEIVI